MSVIDQTFLCVELKEEDWFITTDNYSHAVQHDALYNRIFSEYISFSNAVRSMH